MASDGLIFAPPKGSKPARRTTGFIAAGTVSRAFLARTAARDGARRSRREEISLLAQADKFRQENEGAGRASAIRAIGEAEAAAIKAKSDSLEGEGADKQLMQTVMLRLAEAFETAKVPLVPQIQLGGGSNEGGNAFATLLALMSAMKARELASTMRPDA
jgi:uncharacterized membrane protein YqiK